MLFIDIPTLHTSPIQKGLPVSDRGIVVLRPRHCRRHAVLSYYGSRHPITASYPGIGTLKTDTARHCVHRSQGCQGLSGST